MPVAGEPVRLVRCRHETCGTATRVRVPRALPAIVVRRVVCDGCQVPFECDSVLEVGVVEANGKAATGRSVSGSATRQFVGTFASRMSNELARSRRRTPIAPSRSRTPPDPKLPGWLKNPDSHAWRYLSIPLCAAAVVVGLILIQGSGSSSHSASPAGHAAARAGGGSAGPRASHGASVVKGSSYTLALPAGWQRTEPKNGATFAAAASDGSADATLWIQRDPSLGFPEFESRSLAQLHQLAGSAHVVNRVAGPTAESTVVTLAADSPPGQPAYEVTLRVAGPYRYYLATTVDANASRPAVDGADLIHNSFVPQARGKGG